MTALSSAGTLASSSSRNGVSVPGALDLDIEVVLCSFGTGSVESGSASSGAASLAGCDAACAPAVVFAAAASRPVPSADTFALAPICMIVNEIDLRPARNSRCAMVGLSMTVGASFQPAGFKAARKKPVSAFTDEVDLN